MMRGMYRRATIDDGTDRRAVRLAVSCHSEERAKCRHDVLIIRWSISCLSNTNREDQEKRNADVGSELYEFWRVYRSVRKITVRPGLYRR